jgi:hypothetical protein
MKASLILTGRRNKSFANRIHALLAATGLSAFVGVILVILFQNIHLPPDKLTVQKDAAELASLQTQSRVDGSQAESLSLPSAMAGNVGIDRVQAQPKESPKSEAPESSLIAGQAGSLDRKRNADSGAARKPRAFKRDLEGRPDNVGDPQRQRPVSLARERYEQRGLSSFFAAIGHALGFSQESADTSRPPSSTRISP